MGDWKLLGSILEEVYIHSTIVGKIWLTILFIFRMLVLGIAAEDVWDDEQNAFICNTEQPGCRNVCYDQAFPISLIRYWVLQIIFVSSPSLMYMGHALYRLRALDKERRKKRAQLLSELSDIQLILEEHKRIERELRKLDELRRANKPPLKGTLLCTYIFHIFMRSVVEVGFIMGQYILYGIGLEPLYKCERTPCPNKVDCFVSRPTEKTIFMVFMMAIASVSLFLNLLELSHLTVKTIKQFFSGNEEPDYAGGCSDKKNLLEQQICVPVKPSLALIPMDLNLGTGERLNHLPIVEPAAGCNIIASNGFQPNGTSVFHVQAGQLHSPIPVNSRALLHNSCKEGPTTVEDCGNSLSSDDSRGPVGQRRCEQPRRGKPYTRATLNQHLVNVLEQTCHTVHKLSLESCLMENVKVQCYSPTAQKGDPVIQQSRTQLAMVPLSPQSSSSSASESKSFSKNNGLCIKSPTNGVRAKRQAASDLVV